MRRSGWFALCALMLTLTLAANAAAQECQGLSNSGRGYFAYGFEGTDGATGEGFTLGLRFPSAGIQLQRRSLEQVNLVDEMETLQGLASFPVIKSLPLCVTAGLGWTGYDDDRVNVFGTDAEGNFIQRGTAAGPYMRLQAPVGVSLGKELRLGSKFAVGGFVNPSLVYEFEKYESFSGATDKRSGIGLGFTTGLSVSYSRLLLRSTMSSLSSRTYTLNGFNNFAFLSVQLGVKF
jgi:hypothetical protein